ncbi:uncharacterized protein LOC116767970 [Danaus plexippus]|uniref:uncharacterized protein LOC116767970 n=1 Tax=Danaus plexippus TaxID=13037 RepID=UPI002AB078DD|nr:uncharacterized protein LOC116767970 [Danaus plexippus]
MCEQSEVNYLDGDIVWVKLGSCWWPGEVVGTEKLPPDLLPSFRKPPIAVVKFFQEDSYEYVKNLNSIFKYNCSRKNEFINKGLYMYRTKHGLMEKFPEDVIRAETAVGGDITILTRDEFQETKKESYAGLFGDPAKKNTPIHKKGKGGRGRPPDTAKLSTPMKKFKEKTNYKVHILLQGSKTPSQNNETLSTPSTSRAGSEPTEMSPEKSIEKSENQSESEEADKTPQPASFSTPTMSSSGLYVCHACQFSTQRLNVLILHNKTHSVSFTPYSPSPVKKKPLSKIKSTPVTSKTPKERKRRTEKSEKKERKTQSNKRSAETETISEVKKPKTDEEIKSSLLADWDDGDEESADESSTIVTAGSPEVPMAAESPAVPTPAELPNNQDTVEDKKDSPTQKPESSSDSKYEFCEDEDWPIETDIGRKIPRVKSSSKRNGDKKSVSIDEEEMAREVAELLNKTALPELPSAPEPLKVEENFPEGSIAKSPDKKTDKSQDQSSPEKKIQNDNQPPKTIFKTKTFFRSRHSRSQDAIGKYVAEQLNAAERMDLSESELNGSEVASSPEIRESPQQIKVARLAPKIQFKKSKAEAAQQKEMEKHKTEKIDEESTNAIKDVDIHEDTTHIEDKDKDDNLLSDISISTDEKLYKNKLKHNLKDSTNDVLNDEENFDSPNHSDSPSKNVIPKKEDSSKILSFSEKSFEPYMNESTASAVDALLSVSREADRVTKVISDDPPEDLFEDDVKDSISVNINGFSDSDHNNITQNEDNIEKTNVSTEKLVDNEVSDAKVCDEQEEKLSQNSINDNTSVKAHKDMEDIAEVVDTTKLDVVNSKLISIEPDNNFPVESIPSESDLQVAEALINLPTTTLNNKLPDGHTNETSVKEDKETTNITNDVPLQSSQNFSLEEEPDITPIQTKIMVSPNKEINSRYETEQEKSENLNAAKSLVQMSESIDHKIKMSENKSPKEKLSISQRKDDLCNESSIEVTQKLSVSTNDFSNESKTHCVSPDLHLHSPKLLKILEEPGLPKIAARRTVTKQIIVPRKEKILNVEAGKSPLKPKTQSPKQKIIIRRTTPSKNLLNNIGEITTPDKIILSRTNKSSQDGSSVQTYTIQTSPDISPTSDPNTIIIQPKLRQVVKPVSKLQKIKSQPQTIIAPSKESKITQNMKSKDDSVFDINSMPIVLTPESIEKMPIVMSDGNIITNSSNPPKLVKTKQTIADSGKMSPGPIKEIKPMIMSNEVSKATTPNILSKSQKLRGTKPMLVIDKTTGKQKIIMTKTEQSKEVKQQATLIQSAPQNSQKAEKFIILPSQNSPRSGRTQKIVIDPQTGKAHVLVGKSESQLSTAESNKPVSAKLIPSPSDSNTPGNTVMIITNAQGGQSRIVLTPEHEKILFPNKQQPAMSQLKPVTHRITSGSGTVQKTIVSTATGSTKTQTRIVPKQKSAIITSKGQLIVGGRVATTTQNIAPLPEIRPAPKRILASEPKRLVQTIQKNSSEPLIFLRQNSSAVMQLTVAQFEHLQRTGQIIQKAPTPVQENKIVVQKSITISPKEPVSSIQKQRVRKQTNESPAPMKKIKHEIAIAPAPAPVTMPALTPIAPPQVPNVSSTTTNMSTSNYSDLENLEELLPSTAIVRHSEPTLIQPQSELNQPPPAALSDGQLLAVPGEHFGGPTGSFYLCVEDNGNFTAIDNRPLILENNQLVPMPDPLPVPVAHPERRDILEAALANSDVFHGETTRDEAPDFRDLNANVSVHCRVSETSTTLNQPIMTPVEVPSKVDSEPTTVPSNLEDGLAVIGVTPHTVPTSLELPITVTDPRIAPKTTDPLSNNNYGTSLLPSPNTELTFSTTEDADISMVGPISMPILTDDDNVGGKSMPILTDEVTERTVSSVDSTIGSPSSIDVRESENEDSSQWPRRLLTPCSDTSETSSEIPLQPVMQLSVNDLSHDG